MRISPDSHIFDGFTLCANPRCGAANQKRNARCFNCDEPLACAAGDQSANGQLPELAVPATKAASKKTKLTHDQAYLQLPCDTFEAAILGKPITKGSGIAVAKGVYKHESADELKSWEQAIEDAFRAKYWHKDWEPIATPVAVDYIFTVAVSDAAIRRMKKAGAPEYPVGVPDLDKLQRAAGDGITHRPNKKVTRGPNVHKPHFKLIKDDSYITGYPGVYKTYPKPFHTHMAALNEPGLQVRVRALPPLSGWLPTGFE